MVRGQNILLGSHYEAALFDHDTLVGVYENDGRRMGVLLVVERAWRGEGHGNPADQLQVTLSG
jgi:hypothetical protein